MTFTRLVTKCIAFLSPDDDHLPTDHCAGCQQQPHHSATSRNNPHLPAAATKSAGSSSKVASHLHKRCCVKPQEPKEPKIKKTTATWKLNCAKLISGAKSTSSSSSSALSPNTSLHSVDHHHLPSLLNTSATTCGSAEFHLHETATTTTPSASCCTADAHLFDFPSPSTTANQQLSIVEDNHTPNEDCDETARLQRAREIARGVEPPPGYLPMSEVRNTKESLKAFATEMSDTTKQPLLGSMPASIVMLKAHPLDEHAVAAASSIAATIGEEAMRRLLPNLGMAEEEMLPNAQQQSSTCPRVVQPIHSQVDFMHCLVPDLKKITSSCFYWGKMDRYEAERLLEGKPEGTFLLRDSAQEEFLFSVSFRKYGRSLHARIEQFNHMFSFDCHDPAVATSPSVTGLLEHYKNPQRVMFFEPALTLPLNRNFCFSLQQLCRASIVSQTSYTGIASLTLPVTLKSYLKEYHYKQRVRVKRYDD